MTHLAALLTPCDRELIHRPGSIQPFGGLLVAEPDSLVVHHAAGDIEAMLGTSEWEGAALASLIGPALADSVAVPTGSTYIGQLTTSAGAVLDVSAHRGADDVLVELEPAAQRPRPGSMLLDWLNAAATSFEQAPSLEVLYDRAARVVRELTGFDRVLVYRFLDDDAGRVVAEAKREGMHSFQNHHFPASDIPRQARDLYVRNLVRTIPDITYEPAPLRPAWTRPTPLDMSDSALRSVSPTHLLYLTNMGVAASASVSIVREGVLWGLIACHHETPRALTYDLRVACRALAGGLARQLKAKEEAETYRQRLRLLHIEEDLIRLLSREGTLDEALSNHIADIGRMLDAEGVAVLRGPELLLGGRHPPEPAVHALARWVLARPGDAVWSTDRLADAYPNAAPISDSASGVLSLVLSSDDPWLVLWFRAEQIEIVKWAGNPHTAKSAGGELTPRASFDSWQEQVRGRSRRWTIPEIEAARRLRQALLDVQQSRRLRDLNLSLTRLLRDKDQLLEQKNFLIGEVNHRVQNSLQLVSSFLTMQARAAGDEARQTLEEAVRRLGAVALVHRRLYRGEQVQVVDAARYVEELCADSMASMGEDWARHLRLDLAPVMISTDRAVSLGLVLTELMINIFKYAYGGAPGPVEIGLAEERTNFTLTVADRGSGRVTAKRGFGSRMMDGLVAQIGGTLVFGDNRPGLRAVLSASADAGRGR